jgi:hypothetical protein
VPRAGSLELGGKSQLSVPALTFIVVNFDCIYRVGR